MYNHKPNSYYRAYRRPDFESNRWEILKSSLKTIGNEYCNNSSINGLKHLVGKRTPYIERVIWILTLVGALIGSVTLAWMTFHKYDNAPLVTTQLPEGIAVNKIIFPAIGICSNNRISRRAISELAKTLLQAERNKRYNETEMVSLLFGLGQLYDIRMSDNVNYSASQVHEALGDYDVNDLLRNLASRCEDLLQRCVWNEIVKNCSELFDFRLTMNGYCCTFNYLRQSDVYFEEYTPSFKAVNMYKHGNKSWADFEQGLRVLIRLNESDDFYYNVPLQGAQLQFSDAYDFPDAQSGSFSMQMISPSVEMIVIVTARSTEASRDIQHVPVKLRQCLFYDESPHYLPFYTHSDCLLKCRMLFLLENCNCTPFNMPKLANARTCDFTDLACLRTYYVQSITVRPKNLAEPPPELELDSASGGIDCPMCYPTCSKIAYRYHFFNVKYDPEVLKPENDRNEWLQGANYTGTSMVHIKYERDVADCYGQNVIMKWFDLMSNIGSTCGVLTGFSFVSVLEFIYFFTVKLAIEMTKTRRRENPAKPLEQSPAPNFESIKGYRAIYWNELAVTETFKHRNVVYTE